MLYWYIFLCVVVGTTLSSSTTSEDEDTLVVANVLYRHGDRAPAHPLPKDKHNETFWPYGWGELTDKGKAQQYNLGKFFRKRYDQLLEDKFDYKKIEVRSSDYDRCLVSAYSNLAGMFSNRSAEEDLTFPFVRWQPVPVHTEPVIADELLAMKRQCNTREKDLAQLFNSSVVRQLNADYTDLFKMLQRETGIDLTENGLRDMWPIPDTWFCESQHNIDLPTWSQAKNVTCNNNSWIPCEDRTVMDILMDMSDKHFVIMFNSTLEHKFEGGPLLEDIVRKIDEYNAGNRTVTFNMYSAHDTTVAAVLNALGIFDKKSPQYASSVMIELHRAANTPYKYDVKVLYKNVTDSEDAHEMQLPGCKSTCTLEEFKKITDQYKIGDWDVACKNDGSQTTTVPPSTTHRPPGGLTQEEVIIITICSALVAIMGLAACICYTKRRRISSDYIPMST